MMRVAEIEPEALVPVTSVLAKVTGTGTCAAPRAPSRAFNLALGHVSAGGEVKTLAAR